MLTAVALTAGGVLAVSQAASATPVPSFTKVWFNKTGGTPQPDPGMAAPANALFSFADPSTFEVRAGDTVTVDYEGSCWVDTSEDLPPELTFDVNGDTVGATGHWSDGFNKLSTISGTVSFTMPDEGATLNLSAIGSRCVEAANGSNMQNEKIYTFTLPTSTEPAPASTTVWYKKSDGAPQPDPTVHEGATGTITVIDPTSLEAEIGDEITLDVTAQCWSAIPQIAIRVNGEREWIDGSWFDGKFTGQVSFEMTTSPTDITMLGWDSDCFQDEVLDLQEPLYTFTTPEFECPALPGVNLYYDWDGDWDYTVDSDSAGYSSTWYLNDNGSIDSVGDTDEEYQEDAFDDFSDSATSGDSYAHLVDECVTRDDENANDWGTGKLGDLDVTTQNHYFATADLGRRSWTFTNSTGAPVEGFDVTLDTDFESDDDATLIASDGWGLVNGDGGDETPVVTVLWGGADSEIDETVPVLAAAPVANDYAAAGAQSTAWLAEQRTISADYFDGVIGDSILNWGDDAVDPQVWIGTEEADDSDAIDELETTYSVPALHDGDSVTIVEFAHVQYYKWTEPVWVDTTVANGVIGVAYSDQVEGPEDQSYYYWLEDGALPEGLDLDEDTGAITGTPEGPKGCAIFTVGVETERNDSFEDFTICITEPVVPSTPDEEPQVPTLLLDLTLEFEVGDELADASTLSAANGLKAGSDWTLTMHSTPRVIGSGNANESGSFSKPIDLPLDTPAGAHELVLAGISPAGENVVDRAWFAIDDRGVVTAISYEGPVEAPAATPVGLASTGAEFVAPGATAALLILMAGGGLLLMRRRRVAN